MPTLVTGATGLVGNNVVRVLLDRGQAAQVLVREAADRRPLEGLDIEIIRGDIRDPESVRQAVRGASRVIHAAGHVHIGWTNWEIARQVNVEATRLMAEAARAAGIRMVHVSSVDTLGPAAHEEPPDGEAPPNDGVLCTYVVTKREAECVVLEQIRKGLDAVIVNPGFMLGPWDWKPSSGRLVLHVAGGWGVFAPLGANVYCDVRDVAAAIVEASQRPLSYRRYILAGESISYFDAMRTIARITGGRRPWIPLGPLIRAIAGGGVDLWTKLSGKEPELNSALIAMGRLRKSVSSARAVAGLDYRSRPLEESVHDAWVWFQENGYVRE